MQCSFCAKWRQGTDIEKLNCTVGLTELSHGKAARNRSTAFRIFRYIIHDLLSPSIGLGSAFSLSFVDALLIADPVG